ncbi:MAG: hypothetical protein A3F67_10780 [Verrucomicrobia bacterium RIFCSPHIGHO2_12_FULL_41_10]|nr:MAG: hypothetical protein A3F67_10780 [Verrucomicrobia bacterium RIFCSPHIGHO2_12_FULL_41_10]
MKKIIPTFLLSVSASSSLLLGNITTNYNNQVTGYREQGTGCRKTLENKVADCNLQKSEGNAIKGKVYNDFANQSLLLNNSSVPISNFTSSVSYLSVTPKLMMNPAGTEEVESIFKRLVVGETKPSDSILQNSASVSSAKNSVGSIQQGENTTIAVITNKNISIVEGGASFRKVEWYDNNLLEAEHAEQMVRERIADIEQQLEESKRILISLNDQIGQKESLKPALKAAKEKIQNDLIKLRADKEAVLQSIQQHQEELEQAQQALLQTSEVTREARVVVDQKIRAASVEEIKAQEKEQAEIEKTKVEHAQMREELKSVVAYDQQECGREERIVQAVQDIDQRIDATRSKCEKDLRSKSQQKIKQLQVNIERTTKAAQAAKGKGYYSEEAEVYNKASQNWLNAIEQQRHENEEQVIFYEKIANLYDQSAGQYNYLNRRAEEAERSKYDREQSITPYINLTYRTSNAKAFYNAANCLEEAAKAKDQNTPEIASLYTQISEFYEALASKNSKAALRICPGSRTNIYESWKDAELYYNNCASKEMAAALESGAEQLLQATASLKKAFEAEIKENSESVRLYIQKAEQNYSLAKEYAIIADNFELIPIAAYKHQISNEQYSKGSENLRQQKGRWEKTAELFKLSSEQLSQAVTFLEEIEKEENQSDLENIRPFYIQKTEQSFTVATNYYKAAQAVGLGQGEEAECWKMAAETAAKASLQKVSANPEIAHCYTQSAGFYEELVTEYQKKNKATKEKNWQEENVSQKKIDTLKLIASQLSSSAFALEEADKAQAQGATENSLVNVLYLQQAEHYQFLADEYNKVVQAEIMEIREDGNSHKGTNADCLKKTVESLNAIAGQLSQATAFIGVIKATAQNAPEIVHLYIQGVERTYASATVYEKTIKDNTALATGNLEESIRKENLSQLGRECDEANWLALSADQLFSGANDLIEAGIEQKSEEANQEVISVYTKSSKLKQALAEEYLKAIKNHASYYHCKGSSRDNSNGTAIELLKLSGPQLTFASNGLKALLREQKSKKLNYQRIVHLYTEQVKCRQAIGEEYLKVAQAYASDNIKKGVISALLGAKMDLDYASGHLSAAETEQERKLSDNDQYSKALYCKKKHDAVKVYLQSAQAYASGNSYEGQKLYLQANDLSRK